MDGSLLGEEPREVSWPCVTERALLAVGPTRFGAPEVC